MHNYQIELVYGEWDSYTEEVIYTAADQEECMRLLKTLYPLVIDVLRQDAEGLAQIDFDTFTGYVAGHIQWDGLTVRVVKIPVSELTWGKPGEIVHSENWEAFENMSLDPYYDEVELSRYEHMAEVYELQFDKG